MGTQELLSRVAENVSVRRATVPPMTRTGFSSFRWRSYWEVAGTAKERCLRCLPVSQARRRLNSVKLVSSNPICDSP